MLMIAAALQEELKVALAQCRDPKKIRVEGIEFWIAAKGNRKIYFLKTGVGPKRSAASLQRALQVLDISKILVVGYAGALDPRLRLGELVAVRKALACSIDKTDPAVENMRLDKAFELTPVDSLAETAETIQIPFFFGDTLTTSHVWGNPEHKKILMRKFGATIVDMETAALASVAASFDVPLCCLRVISDESEDSFLKPFSYDPSAGIPRKAGRILRDGNPVKMFRQWKRNTSAARVSLSRFLAKYL